MTNKEYVYTGWMFDAEKGKSVYREGYVIAEGLAEAMNKAAQHLGGHKCITSVEQQNYLTGEYGPEHFYARN